MSGKFIVSLDCEGKWGIADRPKDRRDLISSSGLAEVYSKILQIFEKYSFRATFAFVSALCLEPDEVVDALRGVDLPHAGTNWLATPLSELMSGEFDGWSEPALLRLVRESGRHHVCTHGGTHLPYSRTETPSVAVEWDINFAKQQHERLGLDWGAIVLPRNVVGHLDKLATAGITCYRSMDRAERVPGNLGKGIRLANEFISADRFGLSPAGQIFRGDSPVPLSPGKFLNARIGFRRRVPADATLSRAQAMLGYAATHGRILHLYTHPHNFINDDGMFEKLDAILRMANSAASEGRLQLMTMEDEFNGSVQRS
ncbi:MAG: hypothetical protein EOP38_05130 [Rubrivivax sp.]|nr:MAG: hypothetical protein EOP38_05130 [Rubrivivax sp.]